MAATKEFKRILIDEDKKHLSKIVNQIEKFQPLLQKLKAKFEGLELGPLTDEVYQELVSQGSKRLAQEHLKNLNGQCEKAGITSQIIKEGFYKTSQDRINQLNDVLGKLKNLRPIDISLVTNFNVPSLRPTDIYYSQKRNLFMVGPEQKEKLLEKYCRVYIETEKEKTAVTALENLVKAYNEFTSITDGSLLRFCGLKGLDSFVVDHIEINAGNKAANNKVEILKEAKAKSKDLVLAMV
ncbi:hypothetical protein [Tamlana sp. I1]|uniref:hypothetical protein n=1 Tax=Tamlana sp. I1 TaxID=2762061 RepID=UPI00188FEE73|nr:hypothetical protein [Tamlana sp. I1]